MSWSTPICSRTRASNTTHTRSRRRRPPLSPLTPTLSTPNSRPQEPLPIQEADPVGRMLCNGSSAPPRRQSPGGSGEFKGLGQGRRRAVNPEIHPPHGANPPTTHSPFTISSLHRLLSRRPPLASFKVPPPQVTFSGKLHQAPNAPHLHQAPAIALSLPFVQAGRAS